ncbi:MAG: sigma-70 family RNA polymerase sigma factor [Nannocystaceae bacterium]
MTECEANVDAEGDANLVRLAAGRGLKGQLAFAKLVGRYQHGLTRLLLHLLGSQSDAEDIAQEVFIRAFLAIGSCGDGRRFRGWLRVLARHRAFNHRRDARTRAQYEERSGVLASRRVAPISGQLEGRDLLKQVLVQLADPYREVIYLRFVEDLSVKELAHVLDLGESAAKMRLSRARAEFRRVAARVESDIL